MRPTKITPEIRKRCEQIALLKLQIPTYKQLEFETGVHRNYLAKIIHGIVKGSTLPPGPLEPEKNP
jgi:hypothetical protein